MKRRWLVLILVVVAAVVAVLWLGSGRKSPEPGTVLDEAMQAGRDARSLAGADEDDFHDMDYGYLKVSGGFPPSFLGPLTGVLTRLLPNLFGDGGVQLGPTPKGTPVNLLSNLEPRLLAVSRCPDFVVNRGHCFGTAFLPASEGLPGLSDDDRRTLIELPKTL